MKSAVFAAWAKKRITSSMRALLDVLSATVIKAGGFVLPRHIRPQQRKEEDTRKGSSKLSVWLWHRRPPDKFAKCVSIKHDLAARQLPLQDCIVSAGEVNPRLSASARPPCRRQQANNRSQRGWSLRSEVKASTHKRLPAVSSVTELLAVVFLEKVPPQRLSTITPTLWLRPGTIPDIYTWQTFWTAVKGTVCNFTRATDSSSTHNDDTWKKKTKWLHL